MVQSQKLQTAVIQTNVILNTYHLHQYFNRIQILNHPISFYNNILIIYQKLYTNNDCKQS